MVLKVMAVQMEVFLILKSKTIWESIIIIHWSIEYKLQKQQNSSNYYTQP